MFLFILGIILFILALIMGIGCIINDSKVVGAGILTIGIILSIVCIICSCITSVPTGHTGIVTTFGQVQDYTFEAGINFKSPWQDVVKMDNRNQKQTISLSCFSSDIQEVSVVYTVNFQINKTNAQVIYKSIGVNYYDTVMSPLIQEAVKSVVAKYTAENLIENRSILSDEILALLITDLQQYNIEVLSAAIEDIDFTDTFTNAVEAKQVAQQNLLKAKTEQEQKVMEQEAEAQRSVIQANASAEIAKIQADADLEVAKKTADAKEYAGQKEAAANDAISKSLTQMLIDYNYASRWDGKLPTMVTGDGALPIIGDISTTK